jgi:hypothetical protein
MHFMSPVCLFESIKGAPSKKRIFGGRLAALSLPQHLCTSKKPGENEAERTAVHEL